ncbi:hypothetical protein GCM10028820_03310 [Tessaracoccus terricola]
MYWARGGIDEWLLDPPDESMRSMLLELLERRYDTTSTAFCVQCPKKDWHMDLRMPGMGGRAACEALLAGNSKSRVVFLTSFPEECVEESMRAGAHGYLYKDERPENIIAAVRAVAAGLGVGSRAAVATLVETRPSPDLNQFATDNVDVDLSRLILAGQSNREMAKALHLSESGLKKRINKLMQRAGVASRPMLMAKLYGSGHG